MKTARNTKLFALAGMILVALLLSACVSSAPFHAPAPLAATTAPASGNVTAAGGPVVIVGEAGSANFYASPETFPEPVVAMIDAANVIKQEASFASDKTQILGTFDTAMFPLPAKYSINLPIQPAGTPIDLDNNGKTDTGVQVFALDVASNFTGDSYLQQLEQSGMASYFFNAENPMPYNMFDWYYGERCAVVAQLSLLAVRAIRFSVSGGWKLQQPSRSLPSQATDQSASVGFATVAVIAQHPLGFSVARRETASRSAELQRRLAYG